MMKEQKKKHTGKCADCGGPLELVELDVRKNTRILRCQKCGLLHHYMHACMHQFLLNFRDDSIVPFGVSFLYLFVSQKCSFAQESKSIPALAST